MTGRSDTAGVRRQYERFPYPERDPRDERHRLQLTGLDQLPVVNHYGFGGRKDFREARILVAGGGTGDAAIYLAEQLRDTGARIHYLDISEASLSIARARARVRGLDNIEWTLGSLLEVGEIAPGPFDYINCSGVLHHLADPDAGLRSLESVLAPDGVMGIMVYGAIGRTGIYQAQHLLKLLRGEERDADRLLSLTRKTLQALPRGNWFRRGEDLATDHRGAGDAGLWDLLLHEQDRAYTVEQLHEFIAGAGLSLLRYAVFENDRYRPETYLKDSALQAQVKGLDPVKREAVAELLAGDIVRHAFYCARSRPDLPGLDDDMVPFLWGGPRTHAESVRRFTAKPDAPMEFVSRYHTIEFRPAALTLPLFRRLDGRTSVGKVVAAVAAEFPEAGEVAVRKELTTLYRVLNRIDLMFLRHERLPPFQPDIAALAT